MPRKAIPPRSQLLLLISWAGATSAPLPFLANLRGVQNLYVLNCRTDLYTLRGAQDLYVATCRQDSYSLRGRQDNYAPPGMNMPLVQNFTVPLGDDAPISLIILTPTGTAFDLTGCTLVFGLKTFLAAQSEVLTKSSPSSGIVITNAVGGLATLTLNAADTAALGAGNYTFDVQVITGAGKKSTVITGTLTFVDHPTR